MSRGKVELTIEEYDQLMKLKNGIVSKEKYDKLIEENNDLKESFAYEYCCYGYGYGHFIRYHTKEEIINLVEESYIDFKTNIANSTIFNLLKLRKQYKKEVK